MADSDAAIGENRAGEDADDRDYAAREPGGRTGSPARLEAPSRSARRQEGDVVLSIEEVTKRYADAQAVVDLALDVYDGEILSLLGPSGCGKTTTLRLIAGLERPDEGRVRLRGETVAGSGRFLAPEKRDVGVVFQEFALFPHLSAAENVAFGLTDLEPDARDERVSALLELVGLSAERDRYPDELSGGQQQRIALARSLAPEPSVLLLDEPLSNLDIDLRTDMREEIRRILTEAGVTAVWVTHDQEEALSVADRIAVMNAGRIEQVGPPERVFERPESRFVAGFLGHASFLPGVVDGDRVRTGLGPLPRERIYGLDPAYDGSAIDVLVRPDDLAARPALPDEADGRVTHRRYLGPTVLYEVTLGDDTVLECMHNHATDIDAGTPVAVELAADHDLAWFPHE